MRWSYKTVHYDLKKEGLLGGTFLDESEVEQSLNEYGMGGWELVSILETQEGLLAIFKQAIGVTRSTASDDEEAGRPLVSLRPKLAVARGDIDSEVPTEPLRRPPLEPERLAPSAPPVVSGRESVEERRPARPLEEAPLQILPEERQDDIGTIRIE